MVDGKILKVKGKRHSIVLGVDFTGDIPVSEYEDSSENKYQYYRLFKSLKEIGYNLKGVTSDGNPDILRALRQVYPTLKHQTCLRHFRKSIERTFGYLTVKRQNREKDFRKEIELKDKIVQMIYAKSYSDFLLQYQYIQRRLRIYQTIYCKIMWQKVKYNLSSLTARFFDSKLHTTNNLAENVIKQFNRRLKTIEGFQSQKTAEGYLRLLVTYWRFKPFTDSRYKKKNGKSRLQIAGVNTKKLDWLKISQKPKKI